MLDLFKIRHTALDAKIDELSSQVKQTQAFFVSPSRNDWDNIFELCMQIQEGFKKVRYPTKAERDNAWQRFFHLREKAYDVRKEQVQTRSEGHYSDLMKRLHDADYDALADFIIGEVLTLGLLKTKVYEMKRIGKELGQIARDFKGWKHEMTREHKVIVHERLIEVRENHDGFWRQYKSYQEEKQRLWEEKQAVWQEKQEKSRQAKERMEANLENNKEKLYKAKDALQRFESKRDDLRDKIDESSSDNWKAKAYVWLDEFEEKIKSIEDQIERLERWVDEDEEKLRNWN